MRLIRGDGITDEWRAEITVFEKDGGVLSKRIWFDANAKVCSDGSGCVMTHGNAAITISDIPAYVDLVNTCRSNQAPALGRLRADLPPSVRVVTAQELNGGTDPRRSPASKIS